MALKNIEQFIPNLITSLQDLILDKEIPNLPLYLMIKSTGRFSIFLSDNHHVFEAETINSCAPRKAFFFVDPKNIGYFYKNDFLES